MRSRVKVALHAVRGRLAGDQGFTIIELSLAILVLSIGMIGAVSGFDSARRLDLISERHATMAHMAQREIEQLEGLPYAQIALSAAPSHSGDNTNPDYYVTTANGSPALDWNRTSANATEPFVTSSSAAVTHVRNWSEGNLSGQIYDYITWTTDPDCTSQCPTNGQDYKRLTVSVTMDGKLQPNPVYVSSVMADPTAAPAGGVVNGNVGNPLKNAATVCQSGSGTVPCTSPIDSGTPNVWYLHDFSSWNSGSPTPPSANHATHNTVNVASGGTCSGSTTTGCPQPDLMNSNPPSGDSTTPCYQYSSDQSGTPTCARLVAPSSDSSCSTGNAALSTLANTANELWVTAPTTSTLTLTGEGGFSTSTETANGTAAIVTLCIAVYDVPNSVSNLLSAAPTYLGSASFTPPTDPATSSNWPTGPTATGFIFHFLASGAPYTLASGHRIGVRIWEASNPSTPVAILYDNPVYPSQLQLNSQ